jgi:hypothetical protein
MPSWRAFRRVAYQGGIYEAQDVLVETDDVDLLCLEPSPGFKLREKWLRSLVWRDITGKAAFLNPGLKTIHLNKEYDLFIAFCQNSFDLLSLNAVKGWKEHCRTSVCWIDEIWAGWVPRFKNWLHLLNDYDHVFVNLSGSVRAIENVLERPCHWVPNGIDALRFSPYPKPPARVIDVYSIGRKWEGVHRVLLEQAEAKGLFYIYDTLNVNDSNLPDHRKHRDLISNIAKRSRFFLVAPAKMDLADNTRGQSEVGSRYYEGAASGAVLLGKKPESESFRDLFGWPDAVIEINTDGSDLVNILTDLSGQPERLIEISRRNCTETLLRHDWTYRWKQILTIAGLKPRPALEARENRLKELADMAMKDKRDIR